MLPLHRGQLARVPTVGALEQRIAADGQARALGAARATGDGGQVIERQPGLPAGATEFARSHRGDAAGPAADHAHVDAVVPLVVVACPLVRDQHQHPGRDAGGLLECAGLIAVEVLPHRAGDDDLELARAQGLSAGVVICDEAETLGVNTRQQLAEAEAARRAERTERYGVAE